MSGASRSLSEAELRQWMERLGPLLLNLSQGICRDRHRAEEIVQEAFVRLWRVPPDAGEVAYASWLRKVVTNLSINCLQRTRRPEELTEFSSDPALSSRTRTPQSQLELSDEQTRLDQALARLDETKRAILILRGVEGLSYEAIAEHLGVPVGTVMSRLNRARAALTEEMDRISPSSGGPAATDRDSSNPQARPDAASDSFDIRKFRRA